MTTDCGTDGCSAAIIAVSARKRCTVATVPAATMAPVGWLAVAAGADTTWVSVLSASATRRPAFTPSGVVVTALGVSWAGLDGGIMLLLRITVPTPWAARLPSTA